MQENIMKHRWVVKPLTPEAVYTDRTGVLEYLHHAALEAAHHRTMSTVLPGKRRMGKTEIFKRVVNRLFFEQDPHDPQSRLPPMPADTEYFGRRCRN